MLGFDNKLHVVWERKREHFCLQLPVFRAGEGDETDDIHLQTERLDAREKNYTIRYSKD